MSDNTSVFSSFYDLLLHSEQIWYFTRDLEYERLLFFILQETVHSRVLLIIHPVVCIKQVG